MIQKPNNRISLFFFGIDTLRLSTCAKMSEIFTGNNWLLYPVPSKHMKSLCIFPKLINKICQ